MIRERREEDIDLLCAVLDALKPPASTFAGADFNEWLKEHDAEKSWVFDAAPVTVAPTKNVIGHVQIYKPAEESATLNLADYIGEPAGDLLVIGKLFVQPGTHEYGIARYLLKESQIRGGSWEVSDT